MSQTEDLVTSALQSDEKMQVEHLTKDITEKLNLLAIIREEAGLGLQRNRKRELQRHFKQIEKQLDEIYKLKNLLRAEKVKVESMEAVKKWSKELEEKLLECEDFVEQLNVSIESLDEQKENEQRQKRLDDEKAVREIQDKLEETKPTSLKLPKLVMTKFNGSYTDWNRFWSQFEVEIERTDVSPVTKFSYLKELVDAKVRLLIDGLPFSIEGYERAKNILKTTYGKSSEIVNAHIINIMELPRIPGSPPRKILDFYEKLIMNIQPLETMGKLKEINGYVRMTLDKLLGIRSDLVRMDDDWQGWDFPHLAEAIRKWTERNPVQASEEKKPFQPYNNQQMSSQYVYKRDKSLTTKGDQVTKCAFCDNEDHKAINCVVVPSISERKKILSEKRLCFNCLRSSHRAKDCKSRNCFKCNSKHHTSICDTKQDKERKEPMMCSTESSVTYPIIVIEVNGVKCRALLDTGAGSSYVSSGLVNYLKLKPTRTEGRQIEMLLHTAMKKIDIFQVNITSTLDKFNLRTEVSKVEKDVLMHVSNPRYARLLNSFDHLNGVVIEDNDEKEELPIHVVIGASEFAKIKTTEPPRVGKVGEPVAELTKLGWILMSPGHDVQTKMYLTHSVHQDYERLCSLDVLGIQDESKNEMVYSEFKEQLVKKDDYYETGLIWREGHPKLLSNKQGSLARLTNLLKKLNRDPEKLKAYDDVIQEQLKQGIVERVAKIESPERKEFYLPHKPVFKESAESTKLRIVFDGSARETSKSPSLNDCLETGPSLQNLIWDILVRIRFKPIALTGDLKQAFLQVRIREDCRDVLRFHWIKDLVTQEVQVLRFCRALFGLVQSPFILGGTLEYHFHVMKSKYPEVVEVIRKSLYVDDLIHGGYHIDDLKVFKEKSIEIFKGASFVLHKWHSNERELEEGYHQEESEESTYAKQQFGAERSETKLLGLPWEKKPDTLAIPVPKVEAIATKRGVLQYNASIYDPMGMISPVTLLGKNIFRDACDSKQSWDQPLDVNTLSRWKTFCTRMPKENVTFPRALATFREEIKFIDLHVFSDASKVGTAAVLYAVIHQESGVSQGLLVAKARLSKQGQSIPRLELIACHMAANLIENVKGALGSTLPIRSETAWSDSTVALHWIKGGGNYKQFVGNRVEKIRSKTHVNWRHVPGEINPADIASRGCYYDKLDDLWWKGPEWLTEDVNAWPADIVTKRSDESDCELKAIKEIFAIALPQADPIQKLLEKHTFWKVIRILSWIRRFISNSSTRKSSRRTGPLITVETEEQIGKLIKRDQLFYRNSDQFEEDKLRLNLQPDGKGVYRCRGRIQGEYPIYLSPVSLLSEKMVMNAHLKTLHGGVGMTMSEMREKYWIPRLRQLTKKTIYGCNGCKRFRAVSFSAPTAGLLPRDRTEGERPFQIIGLDFAGPITYKQKNHVGKSYILLFTCSLTRAVYIDLLHNQTFDEFLKGLKRLIARRGRPEKIYSDNASTFKSAAHWIKMVMKDERLHDYLANHNIKWQFNLSRAPWWGGQFERIVGLVKQSLYKVMGNSTLTWSELEEVLLDVETALNNRPLGYVEDDVQLPTLTPNIMLYGIPNHIPEADVDDVIDVDLRKRAKYLQKCKVKIWKRWSAEYVKSLRERHNLKTKTKSLRLNAGDVVLIRGDVSNRGKWKIGIVEDLIDGKDGVTRAATLKSGKHSLQRAVQHLYPLELSCDATEKKEPTTLNVKAKEYRPKREAAKAAKKRISDWCQTDIEQKTE